MQASRSIAPEHSPILGFERCSTRRGREEEEEGGKEEEEERGGRKEEEEERGRRKKRKERKKRREGRGREEAITLLMTVYICLATHTQLSPYCKSV